MSPLSWVFLTITDAVEAVSSFEPPVKAVKAGDDGQDDLPDGDERALHSHPAPQPEDSEAVSM